MSVKSCILCFGPLLKGTDLNLVNGKSKIIAELDDLPFVVHDSSPCICKKYLAAMKKRSNLKRNLNTIEDELTSLYHQKCGEHGLTMKRRGTESMVSKKVQYQHNPNETQCMPLGINQEDLEEKLYSSRFV